MKYTFELYEHANRGLQFKGYQTIHADDAEVARLSAQDKFPEYNIVPIYVPQESQ
jgi:1,2-phenylacetyl-CoA epoxidase PaaB subunit